MGDEMPSEVDMRGGTRGTYVDAYRRWADRQAVAGITDAVGAVVVPALTSAAGASPRLALLAGPSTSAR